VSINTNSSPSVEVCLQIFRNGSRLKTERIPTKVDALVIRLFYQHQTCTTIEEENKPGFTTLFDFIFDLDGMMNFSLKDRK